MRRLNTFPPARIILMFLGLSVTALHAELITKSPYYDRMGRKLLFQDSDKGMASCHGPGCLCDIGFSYVIEQGDTIRVTKTSKPQNDDNYCPVALLHMPCKLKTSTEDKIYSNQIICGGEDYTNVKASIAVNTQTEINSVPVIFLGRARGHATTAVKMRAAPDATSEAGKCYNDGGMIETLQKKDGVEVVARTVSKFKVANWENYWYFVTVDAYECQFTNQKQSLPYHGAWVFGEFIKYKAK